MKALTQKFIAALDELHRGRNAEPLVELFGAEATLSKAGLPHREHGQDGARTFWQQYRDVFDEVEASFTHTLSNDTLTYLEWTSKGTLANGSPFSYEGMSVLESQGDTITAFRTYYDTAAFLEKRTGVA